MPIRLFAKARAGEKERIPPDQSVTKGWPVLHEGPIPTFDPKSWDFRIFGEVEEEIVLSYDAFMALPMARIVSDIHCVTGWSKLDNVWEGVSTREVVKLAALRPEAKFVMVHAENGYTANVALEDFLGDDVLFAHRHGGKPLTPEHGWPLRLVLPGLYFWKSAKWVRGIEFMRENRSGYWEKRGYNMWGDPWKNQRYWGDGGR